MSASSNLIRDAFEGMFVVAIGGMLWSSIAKMRRHEIPVVRCAACGGATSRVYKTCPRCGS